MPCNAYCQISAMCSTRGGSQARYITFASAMRIRQPTLALKPRGDVTRNPKQGYQWPQNRTCVCVRQKYFKKRRYNLHILNIETLSPSTRLLRVKYIPIPITKFNRSTHSDMDKIINGDQVMISGIYRDQARRLYRVGVGVMLGYGCSIIMKRGLVSENITYYLLQHQFINVFAELKVLEFQK